MYRVCHLITDLFFVCFGVWSLVEILCYILDLSFVNMVWIGFSMMLVSALIVLKSNRFSRQVEVGSILEQSVLIIIMLSAVVLTICLFRPDADDQFYLTIALGVLDAPSVPLSEAPLLAHVGPYMLTSYEMFRAAVSYVTGWPILYSYYLIVPGFFAIFVVTSNWRLLRLMSGDEWIAGILFFLLVMIAWGDVHRTYPNFGFVRLFQGKAGFVSIVIPGIYYYFYKLLETREKRYIILLLLTLLCGVGFTPTGISIGTMIFVLLLVCNINVARGDLKKNLLRLASILPLLLLGVYIMLNFKFNRQGVHTPEGTKPSTTTYAMMEFVMGKGLRGGLALLSLVISPLLIDNKSIDKHYKKLMLLLIILLSIPWTSNIVAQLSVRSGSWRWLWCIPFPIIMAFVAGKLYSFRSKLVNGPIFFLLLCISFYFAEGSTVISQKNKTSFSWPMPKIPNQQVLNLRNYKKVPVKSGRVYLRNSDIGL